MHKRELKKPDGRSLILYAKHEISNLIIPTNPPGTGEANPHLRYHPLRGEWVAYAAHRQERPFLPPSNYNPLAPSDDPHFPTELPIGEYNVAVFENRFPSLIRTAHDPPANLLGGLIPTQAGTGVCEVVVFTQDPEASLSMLPLWHIELILEVWADRYRKLGAEEHIKYVMPFENRGVEMGVTLYHPHGQIYAYDHVPPIPALELKHSKAYLERHGRGLFADIVQAELSDGRRIIYASEHVVAFVPACARYPYEVWLAPIRAAESIDALTDLERAEFARGLKTVLSKYDHLFAEHEILPYLMVMHQAPTDGQPHPEAHLHLEFYPPYRSANKLKYLAGTELGAGLTAMDQLPEQTAARLQNISITLDGPAEDATDP